MDRFPRREQRERCQEACQDDQQQADAVHAQVVLDAEHRNPCVALFELVGGDSRVEPPPQNERCDEGHQRRREGDPPHERFALVIVAATSREQHKQSADQRQENDEGQHGQRAAGRADLVSIITISVFTVPGLKSTGTTQGSAQCPETIRPRRCARSLSGDASSLSCPRARALRRH